MRILDRCSISSWSTAALLLLGSTADSAGALSSFTPPRPLSAHAALDDGTTTLIDLEFSPTVEGDGSGNWVAVWSAKVGAPLNTAPFGEIVSVRSSDDAATWSAAQIVDSTTGVDSDPSVVTDRHGVWLAVWRSSDDSASLLSRSVDNGATWSSAIDPFAALLGSYSAPRMATDGAGTWVIVASATPYSVRAVRSADNGLTWGTPFNLEESVLDSFVNIATDGAGTWVAFWQRGNLGGNVGVARSTDNGLTWSAPTIVGELGNNGNTLTREALGVASGGPGRWVVVWEATPVSGLQLLRYSASTDNGATWSPQATLVENATDITLQTGSDGTIHAGWIGWRGNRLNLYAARSIDGGGTWSSPAALTPAKPTDATEVVDQKLNLGQDGNGGWVASWTSLNSLGGTIGVDTDILFARAHDDCPSLPMAGCKAPTSAGASRLRVKDDPDGSGDRVVWTWGAGQETVAADLGDPATTSAYVFCLYDKVGASLRPVFEADAQAGATCGGGACWADTGDEVSYRDAARENGAVTSLRVTAGAEGRSRIKLKMSGDTTNVPYLPLAKSPAVRAQLINLETSACWEATYTTATDNEAGQFRASSD